MAKRKVINVISGKGGTGKTLLTAVLADMLGNADHSVVIVDLDIFVRGLTALLFYHKNEKIQLTEKDECSVAEFFIDKGDVDISGKRRLAISRYRSFDVIPSVSRVDEILKFSDMMPDDKAEASRLVGKLLDMIPDNYDFVLLDSRAGYDELIAASHSYSDLSICVEEEDNISKITSENLLHQLKEDSDLPVFRLINKVRDIRDERDFTAPGITTLGKIPFDMDVMSSFGTKYFWDDISRTFYKSALASAWNNLSNKMDLNKKVDEFRVSPFGSDLLETKLQFYNVRDRVLILYGLIVGLLGISYGYLGKAGFEKILSSSDGLSSLLSFVAGVGGIVMSVYVLFKKKK